MLIKDTLADRKNTSPANIYETGQLYAAGALRVACIGLQCVGFNHALYAAILGQAEQCHRSGRWRRTSSGGSVGSLSLLKPSVAWDANANFLGADAFGATLTVGGYGNRLRRDVLSEATAESVQDENVH